MSDPSTTNQELLKENSALKQKIQDLEQSEAERKRAENELRFSRQQLQLLIDSGPDLFFLKDLDLRYQSVNSALAKFFGRDEADILGRTDVELMPEGAAACQEGDRLAIHDRKLVVTIERVGERFYETHKFPVIDINEVVGVAGIIRDITDQKRAEEALLESEAKYRALVEHSLAGVYIYQDNLFRFVNKRLCEIFGYTCEELVDTLGPMDVTHPEDRILVQENSRRFFAGELDVLTLTHRAIRKDGKTITVSILGSRPMIYKGHVASSGTVYDITEQVRAEEELRQKTALLEAQLNSSLDAIVIVDSGRKLLQNQQFNDLFNIPRDIAENDDNKKQMEWFMSLVKNPERLQERRAYMSAHQDETTRDELELKDGTVLDRYTSRVIGRDGKHYGRIWTFRDITERKRAEKALRESEERYRNAFEFHTAVKFLIDPDTGRIIEANNAAVHYYGWSREQLLQMKIQEINALPPEDVKKAMEKARIEKQTHFEFRHRRADGSVRDVEVLSANIEIKGKDLLHSIIHDITSRKLSEEALTKSTENLRRALSGTIKVISATVEIRDPYTSGHQRRVSGLARAIAQGMALPAETIDAIRLAGIIHDIGKISVPAEILSKPGTLTNIEMKLIKTHSQSGYDVLRDAELPYPIAEVILQHHEKLDGSGYPRELKGENILLEARIITVADVVEAIASNRPYRPARGIDAALEEIEKNKGTLYDARVVEVCVKLFRKQQFSFEQHEE